MDSRRLTLVFSFALGALSACSSRPAAPPVAFTHEFFGMGAPWLIEADAPAAIDEATLKAKLSDAVLSDELVFSDWTEESELRQMERQGLTRWHRPSPRFLLGLKLSQEAWQNSHGTFDLTVGALQWKALSRPVGMGELEIKGDRFRFRRDPKRLTFGGLAKGLSVGALAQILEAAGFRHYRVNGGGGNLALRSEAGHEAWPEIGLYDLKEGQVWHISRSRALRPDSTPGRPRQHIYDPKNPRRTLRTVGVLICAQRPERRLEEESALTDAASKVLIIEGRIELGAHCRVP